MRSVCTSAACSILAVLFCACGGPDEYNPGDSPNTVKAAYDACAPGAEGLDSDGDGLTDECERFLGTDPFNADTTGNGIQDGQDNPQDGREAMAEAGFPVPPPSELRDAAEQSFWMRLLHTLAPSLLTGHSALRGEAVPGVDVRVRSQILGFGPLKDITDARIFTDYKGFRLSSPPQLWLEARHRPESPCNDSNNIFFMAEGEVSYSGQTPIPTIVEFCGIVDLPEGGSLQSSTNLSEAKIVRWTIGASAASGFFNPSVFEGDGTSVDRTFSNLVVSDLKDDLHRRLDFTLNMSVSIFDRPATGGHGYTVQSDTIEKSWKRTWYASEQVGFSKGFLGLWASR